VLQLCSRAEGRSRWIGNLGRRSEQIENEAVQQNDILTCRIINPLPKKSPAFAILLKSPPLILRHLNKAVFGKTGIFSAESNLCNTSSGLAITAPALAS
jgi:hypothetical protein